MKKSLYRGLLCVAAVSTITACTDGAGFGSFGKGKGKISLVTEVDASVGSARSRAEYTDVTAGDLAVKLTSADGSFSQTWAGVADFPTDQEFNVGAYTLEVSYGNEDTEGFESPYFYGSQTLKVSENEVTPVTVTATLANAMVSIDYTDTFKNYMSAWSAEVHSAGGTYTTFTSTETRPAYVKAGDVVINVDVTKPNGVNGRLEAARFTAEARHHYHVTIDIEGGAGNAQLVISLDDSLDQEDIVLDISDEVLNAPAPEVETSGFAANDVISFVPGTSLENSAKMNIIARAGLKSIILTTNSTSLENQGWPRELDLCAATAEQQTLLKSLGLKTLGVFGTVDKMAVIDFTAVAEHIRYLASGNNNTVFSVEVKDKGGKVSEPVSFTLAAESLSLSVANAQAYVGGASFSFTLNFNGGNPADKVKVKLKNDRGTWDTLSVTYTETAKGVYTAVAQGVAGEDDMIVQVSADGLTPIELTIPRNPQVVKSSTGTVDTWARKAIIPVTIGSQDSNASLLAQMMGDATVMVSTDGKTFKAAATTADASAKTLTATGLTPGATYTAKIRNGEQDLESLASFTFTTEAAAQLTNGNCETAATKNGNGSNWENYVFTGWGTNNAMTTSQGADYGYCRISGTIPTTDAHSGSAIALRTCGWGSGNTAISSNGTSGVMKYMDAGLYHLGATRSSRPSSYSGTAGPLNTDDLDCGVAFTSRPSSLKFWFKYDAKNGADKGQAYIWIKDANGNVIATATRELSSQSSYTQVELPLTYTSSAKAAKIYVRFMSTVVEDAVARKSGWLSGPGFANLSRGTYMGSTLYIDDIELTY